MKRKLTKSNRNIVLTGTLAGIAEYFGIDPTIVRIIYVFITLAGIGSPIILYFIMAMVIPSSRSNYSGRPYGNHAQSKRQRKEAEKVDEDDWSDF